MGVQVIYEQGARSASEIQTMIEEAVSGISQDGDLAEELSQHGVEPSTLMQGRVVSVSQRTAGFDVTQVIIDLLGPMTYDVWRYVILPRIVRRHGADVLGKEQDGDSTLR